MYIRDLPERTCSAGCACCILSLQVVWDDSIMRLFVVPTAARALGLVFRAIKGQVDFEAPVGECVAYWRGCMKPWTSSQGLQAYALKH